VNNRPRVLLADDHTMLLDAFRRLLEPRCEIVGTACDGRALLELAADTKPDVIVLDIGMPRLNGMDACAQLRRKMPAVSLVFLTVNEDPDIAAEAIGLALPAICSRIPRQASSSPPSSGRSRARPTSRRSLPRACLWVFSSVEPRSLPRRS
jgi:DNA-binding NarL/FixJ family response regulator